MKKLAVLTLVVAQFVGACGGSAFTGATGRVTPVRAPAVPPDSPAVPVTVPPAPPTTAAPAAESPPSTTVPPPPTEATTTTAAPTTTAMPVTTAPPVTTQPPAGTGMLDDGIEFGADKVFHIGDGNMTASSCQADLAEFPLSGTKYYFDFEVLADDTDTAISVQKICGVDYGDSNFVKLLAGGDATELARTGLQPGEVGPQDPSFVPFEPHRLAKGTYSILIESDASYVQNHGGDFDDFVVGQIKVKANHQLRPLGVRAE